MPTIYVENRPYEVPEGQNVLHACLSLGFDIPYFCWHPGHALGRRLPAMRGQAIQRSERHQGQDRDGLHAARHRGNADFDSRCRRRRSSAPRSPNC